MKNSICIFFFLSFLLVHSQNNKTVDNQKFAFSEAERYLKSDQIDKAKKFFEYTFKLDNRSKIADAVRKKLDSLEHKKVDENILGKWLLVESGSNWGFTSENEKPVRKVIIISRNEIQFYEENIQTKESKLIKTEKIVFTIYKDMSDSAIDFVFSNRLLWRFYFDENKNILRQINTGDENDEGRTELVCGNSELNYKKYDL